MEADDLRNNGGKKRKRSDGSEEAKAVYRRVCNNDFMTACRYGDVDVVAARLACVPRVRTRAGGAIQSGFLQAIYNNRCDVARLLLESGYVKINQKHPHRWPLIAKIWPEFSTTALIEACDNMHVSVEMLRLLLEHGADTALTDYNGNNALATACLGCLELSWTAEIVRVLLAAGSDPNSRSFLGKKTVLQHLLDAILFGHKELSNSGLGVHRRASSRRNIAELKASIFTLLSHGAHADIPDVHGNTLVHALHQARRYRLPGNADCEDILGPLLPLPLTCLASQTICRLQIPYSDCLPRMIVRLVELHEASDNHSYCVGTMGLQGFLYIFMPR